MSLVVDEFLRALWSEAQKPDSHESASVAFWNHLLSKYIFSGKEWFIMPETAPAENDDLLRVDLAIKYLGGDHSIEVLFFHEMKRTRASVQDLEQVEYQAYRACISYLAQHPHISSVYALTSYGTKARGWVCTRSSQYLEPLFGSEDLANRPDYIEAHSSEAATLSRCFNHMKMFPPVARKGVVQGNLTSNVDAAA